MNIDFKKKMFFTKFRILFYKAQAEGKISEFDEEIYQKMSNTIISCLPVSIFIKYSKYLFPQGSCYERSLFMFLALDDALLVRGKNKDLEYNFGKENAGHGWIEIGDYVYDPSTMLKFKKDTYYSLYECSNVYKINKTEYLKDHQDFVNKYVSSNYDDYKQHGSKRLDLGAYIFQINALLELIKDEQFKKDLDDYLTLVEYDPKQIKEEENEHLQKLLLNTVK